MLLLIYYVLCILFPLKVNFKYKVKGLFAFPNPHFTAFSELPDCSSPSISNLEPRIRTNIYGNQHNFQLLVLLTLVIWQFNSTFSSCLKPCERIILSNSPLFSHSLHHLFVCCWFLIWVILLFLGFCVFFFLGGGDFFVFVVVFWLVF